MGGTAIKWRTIKPAKKNQNSLHHQAKDEAMNLRDRHDYFYLDIS